MAEPVTERDLRRWAEALAGIAKSGLAFTENLYERERYEEILAVAGEIKATANHGVIGLEPPTVHRDQWLREVTPGRPGYTTPKLGVGAAVSNDRGELLLMQRADSGLWLYPTGYCDVGYSAVEVVVKEVREETGIEVEPLRLIGILDTLRLGSRIPLYSMLFHCRATGGDFNLHPLECSDAGWFTRDNLPEPLLGGERWVEPVFAAINGELRDVFYDDVRSPIWKTGHE